MYSKSRFSLTSPTTTTTTTTPAPEVDPYEYEKSVSAGRITDTEIEKLKDIVRLDRGLRDSSSPIRKPINVHEPSIRPRPNETSRIRMELRTFRLMRRCGNLVGQITPDQELMLTEKRKRTEDVNELLRRAKELTLEDVELETERAELERLREIAVHAKEEGTFRGNVSSEMRYKHVRGEPILTSRFQETFYQYMKPPFETKVIRDPLLKRRLPAIDKEKEMWLWPVDDADDIGLSWKCDKVVEKRPSRQQLRPKLKAHSKTRRTSKKSGAEKKIPWNYGALSSPLLIGVRNNLYKDRTGEGSELEDMDSATGPTKSAA